MYRIRMYQSLLLFGLSIYPDCFSSAQLCVKREDVYKTPKAPPVALHISEFPDDDVIPIGYNITIACIGNSSKEGDSKNSEQPFWIQLFFNSIKVKTCGGLYSDRQESKICKLHIKKISKNHSGEYGCIVSNRFGCTTAALSLDLKEPSKPQFSTHPISRNNILTGQSVNFSCEALGIPKPVITWFKDGRRVPKDEIKGIKAFSLLTFESVERQDQGRYWCEANNNEGWNRSNVANLTVIWKPRFSIHPGNVVAKEESDVIFKCAAIGFPSPEIIWLKDDSFIPNLTLIQNGSISYLVLHSIKKEQSAGVYKCVAVNSAGNTSSTAAMLAVTSKAPGIPTINISQHHLESEVDEGVSPARSFTIVWASVGSLVFVVSLVAIVFILRRFWCKKEIIKLDDEIAENQDAFPLLDITEGTIAHLRDEQTVLEIQAEADRDENEVFDEETYLREMGIDRNWQIPREKLEITDDQLGRGEFGMVNKGFYMRRDGSKLPVAVKTLIDNNNQTQRLALISEMETLTSVGRHPNIVSLVGACTFEEPLYVVIEFVPGGSLDKLLHNSQVHGRIGQEDPAYANIWSRLTERELLQIASDIANGMKHLESKLCVHRDLAARNILVGNGLIAKVADFGMARDVSQDGEYIKTTEGRIPWLWMPSEALRGRFTTMSDVWSFGVLLWEIVTLGKRPYKGVTGLVELHSKLKEGERLQKPPHCSEELFSVMSRCWQECPEERPTFKELHLILHDILHAKVRTYINVQYFEEQVMRTSPS